MDLYTFVNPRKQRPLVDITNIAFQENYILLSQYPEEESRLTAVIRPFNDTVGLRVRKYIKEKKIEFKS